MHYNTCADTDHRQRLQLPDSTAGTSDQNTLFIETEKGCDIHKLCRFPLLPRVPQGGTFERFCYA